MIQIDLLPDVKQEYLRAKRTRNLAVSISILAGLIAGGVVAVLVLALLAQTGRNIYADNRIKDEYAKLTSTDNLSELVTLQNQLSLISTQHNNKSMDSRMFSLLEAINPQEPNAVSFSAVRLDPEQSTMTLEGKAKAYPAVEALAKTIMNTKMEYSSLEDRLLEPVASKVSVTETALGEDSDGRRVVRFEIALAYNQQLFVNSAKNVKIVSPTKRINVTDSKLGVPESLFTAPAVTEDGEDE